jgi:hypothetical protein
MFQGQTTIYAKFGKNVYLPEDAEFYFIYDGSHQRHVVIAQRVEDNVLQSSIPGEVASLLCSWEICLEAPRDIGQGENQEEKEKALQVYMWCIYVYTCTPRARSLSTPYLTHRVLLAMSAAPFGGLTHSGKTHPADCTQVSGVQYTLGVVKWRKLCASSVTTSVPGPVARVGLGRAGTDSLYLLSFLILLWSAWQPQVHLASTLFPLMTRDVCPPRIFLTRTQALALSLSTPKVFTCEKLFSSNMVVTNDKLI